MPDASAQADYRANLFADTPEDAPTGTPAPAGAGAVPSVNQFSDAPSEVPAAETVIPDLVDPRGAPRDPDEEVPAHWFGDRVTRDSKSELFGKEKTDNAALVAPRLLEMRLKALASRVESMHKTWKAQRADPSSSAFRREAKRIHKELQPIVLRVERTAAISIHVRDLASQSELYDHKGDALRNPASNQKMLTAAAALDLLGPEYRFETSVYRGGVVLYLVGQGDPTLSWERLKEMAQQVTQGYEIEGVEQLVADESAFSAAHFIPGFELDKVGFSYNAPVGALSLNRNAITVAVWPTVEGRPVRVTSEPNNRHLFFDSRAVTTAVGATGGGLTIRTPRQQGKATVVEVRGSLPEGNEPVVQRRRIYDPGLFTGDAFATALAEWSGGAPLPVKVGVRPKSALLLKSWSSIPLFEIVKEAVARSDNFATEQVLRTMAWKMTGRPGSWDAGKQVLEAYWGTVGANAQALVVDNGSGLSRTGRFTARGIVDLVSAVHIAQPPNAGLLAVLPVAGKSGTLRNRHLAARGRLRAKTGTLNGVSALSGVLTTAGGEPVLGMSIMLNPGKGSSMTVGQRHKVEEEIVNALLEVIDRRGGAGDRRGRRRSR